MRPPGGSVAIEFAEVSLTGDREDNQDRAAVATGDGATLLVVMDGMGGHAYGARAGGDRLQGRARTLPLASRSRCSIRSASCISRSAARIPPSSRSAAALAVDAAPARDLRGLPRAAAARPTGRTSATAASITCARAGALAHPRPQPRRAAPARGLDHARTRSPAIRCATTSSAASAARPMLPEMTISRRQPLEDGDVLLVCSDGVWANLKDAEIATF